MDHDGETPREVVARVRALVVGLSAAAAVTACAGDAETPVGAGTLEREPFGTTPDGAAVELYTLTNANGIELRAMTYGAIIVSLRVPDRTGRLDDVVLGLDDLDAYLAGHPQFGTVVGRYANRIGGGRFELDGETYTLARNNGPNHLHGGARGFDKRVWSAEAAETESGVAVTFSRVSPHGEEGYPGTVEVSVTYTLTPDDAVVVDYRATTDRATPINLSQHSYFNLAGAGSGDVLGHLLTVRADRYTPFDETQIPTGETEPVAGTPLDFRVATPVGERIDDDHPELAIGGGYDHNFVLDRMGPWPALAARLEDPVSGRVMEVLTTEPGMQLYTANGLGEMTGKDGRRYGPRHGICLETQHFPDSPNHPAFPTTILRPGEVFESRTIFAFSTS